MPDPDVRTIEVRFVMKSLFQLQTGIAQLALALLKKARSEGLESFTIPPETWRSGTAGSGWVDLNCDRHATINADCEIPPSVDGSCDIPPLVDDTCENPPPVDEDCEHPPPIYGECETPPPTGEACENPPPIWEDCETPPPIYEDCENPPPIGERCREGREENILDDTCAVGTGTENECDDAAEMFCDKIESIIQFLRLLCTILRYRPPV